MQNPICVMCEEKGLITPAEVTDHKKAINAGGSKTDPDNLQSLCKPCHMDKSNQERKDFKNG